jgi:hypothetical protein
MEEKYVSKVVLGDQTLIDISGDTVTPETLAEGATAHNSAGEEITGTMKNLSEVDASKVIFDQEVTTGYAVGNIKLTNGKGILAEKGATLLQVMKNIWTKANPPTVEQPSVTVSISMSGSYEAGYPISQRTYTATFDKGSYEYDDDTGVTVTKWVIDGKETTTSAVSMSGTLSSITVTENTNTRLTATAHHTAGIVPKDSLGDDDVNSQISAGSVTGYSAYLTGYRNTFYGVLTSKDALTNSNIRTVCWKSTMKQSNANWYNGKTFTISIPKSTDATPIYRVLIAYPATLQDLTEVIDKNDSNANIVSGFTLVKDADGNLLKIGGYQNYSPIEYKVYIQDFANPYDAANTYTVKI